MDSNNLKDVFKRCFRALTNDGVMYCSFKYGTFEGIRNERHFVDVNEETIKEYIEKTGFKIVETMITYDVRPNREDKWLNVVLTKNE